MDRDRIIKIKDMITKIKDKQVFKEIFYIDGVLDIEKKNLWAMTSVFIYIKISIY